MMPTEQQVVVTAALIVIVGLIAMFLGRWWGLGQGRDQGYEERVREEEKEAREQAKARRTHPVYRQPPEIVPDWRAHDPTLGGKLHDIHGGPGEDCWCGYVGHDPPAPIDTGEIQAITDRVDEWMATWIGDGHALRDS